MKLKRPKNGYEYDLAVELATASMQRGLHKMHEHNPAMYSDKYNGRFAQDYDTMSWLSKCRSKLVKYLKKQKS